MIRSLIIASIALFSLVIGFFAGYYAGLPEKEGIDAQQLALETLQSENGALKKRNAELRQTLDLVKRQIQTDRIAYAEMQKTVEDADGQRQITLQKLDSQRQLLERLKKKIENL